MLLLVSFLFLLFLTRVSIFKIVKIFSSIDQNDISSKILDCSKLFQLWYPQSQGEGFDAARQMTISTWKQRMGRRKSIKTSILGLRYLVTMTALSLCETVEARKIVTDRIRQPAEPESAPYSSTWREYQPRRMAYTSRTSPAF